MAKRGPYKKSRTVEQRFSANVWPEPNSGCWLWGGAVYADGYGAIRVAGKTVRAHRLSWELYRGPIQKGMEACHKCDNPACVNPEHLFIGSKSDNARDMWAKGRGTSPFSAGQGENHFQVKLTEPVVLHIRALRPQGRDLVAMAASLRITPEHVRGILAGKTWRHI